VAVEDTVTHEWTKSVGKKNKQFACDVKNTIFDIFFRKSLFNQIIVGFAYWDYEYIGIQMAKFLVSKTYWR
jgi:hypothetical protein